MSPNGMSPYELLDLLRARGAELGVEGADLSIHATDEVLEALLPLVRQHKAELVRLLSPKRAPYRWRVSPAQARMLLLEELVEGRSYYNIPAALRLCGPLDVEALRRGLDWVVSAHDILRTRYLRGEQGIEQCVDAPGPVQWESRDLTQAGAEPAALETLLAAHADHRFQLADEWPLRALLVKLADGEHVLALTLHHIAADGLSARRLYRDLEQAYAHALGQGQAPQRPALQYADLMEHQERLGAANRGADLAYWTELLHEAPQLHGLMPDMPRAPVRDVAGAVHRQALPEGLAAAVQQFALQRGVTPFTVYQAVFAATLARHGGEDDVVFGVAAANRLHPEAAQAIGLFVNTLALRFQLGPDSTLASLLEVSQRLSVAGLRHQALPFDALVEALNPGRSAAYNPLLQIMLTQQDGDPQALRLHGLSVRPIIQSQPVAKFDIALHLHMHGDDTVLAWEYASALFLPATIEALSHSFVRLLQGGLAEPERPLASFAVVPVAPASGGPAEAAARVEDSAGGEGAAALPTAIEAFAALVRSQPHALAVSDEGQRVSYAQLDELSSAYAAHLARLGVGDGCVVAVGLARSVHWVASLLALFKLGAAYLPIDPRYPAERIGTMLRTSQARGVLLSEAQAESFPPAPGVARWWVESLGTDGQPPLAPLTPDPQRVAYVLFTSGSTGEPKGVEVTQVNLAHSLLANREVTCFGPSDSMPTIGSQAFGASLLELLLPLTSGGSVKIVRGEDVADIDRLAALSSDVTVLHAVPSLAQRWLDAAMALGPGSHAPLRLMLVGGEPVTGTLLRKIRRWRPDLRVLALYGMTESTIVCASHEPQPDDDEQRCMLGRPYRHARFHVLGPGGQEQPAGAPGELYIGGASIAKGYLNRPELTAERFVPDRLRGSGRLYRTGDRVRRLADGRFEFLGRTDHQIKLRGVRIELGEIEALAQSVDGVSQAAAWVPSLPDDEEATLTLYYVTAPQHPELALLEAALHATFRTHLPEPMRPAVLMRLDRLPQSPNGKVDRRRLPAPRLSDPMVAPATETERQLLALCQTVLRREDFGVTANFFEVGGNSLQASRLVTQIREGFGVDFPIARFYGNSSVRACAAVIEAAVMQRMAQSLTQPAPMEDDDLEEVLL